jgi:putative ABC transport system permease protein
MFDYDNWQEIFSTLKKNKLRSILTAFGIFWGILMLIVMLGCGNGLQNGASSDFSGFATNSFYLWTQSTSKPYKGFKRNRTFDFNNSDIQAIKDNIKEVEIASPRNQLGDYGSSANVIRGNKSGSFSVMGDYPEFTAIQPIKNLKGRFINHLDLIDKRKIAIIGNRSKDVLFGKEEDPINKYIKINGIYFLVVGHFKSEKTNDGGELAESIFIPFTTFQNAFNSSNKVGWFSITSKEKIPASIAQEKVLEFLKQRHQIAPDDKQAIGSWNPQEELLKMQGLFLGIRILIWIVGIGTLLAGIIGVSNIMLIVIKERTREIGIKRAIGANPNKIIIQILTESIFLTVIAGYLGLLSGLLLLEFISNNLKDENAMFRSPEVNLNITLIALLILVIGGLLAGLIPSRRAVKITPVNALRNS